jgi:enoyl-CoA hydratase/carnithine racemase
MNVAVPAPQTESAASPMVVRQDVESIALLALNRPESRNALSAAMIEALDEAFTAIAADRAVRAVVLAAEGPAFSAGHDLKEITAHRRDGDGGLAYTRRLMERCSALMQTIMALPQPVIAAVGATTTAAGCQLVATCDLAVASSAARFATPGVHIGLFCSTPMVALTRNIAAKHAMEMLLTGEMVSAEDACRMGLVNRVVPPGRERDEARAIARKIAAKSTLTIKLGKHAFYRQREMSVADAYRYAGEVMVENMMARDAAEGIGAFVDKRTPHWEDR